MAQLEVHLRMGMFRRHEDQLPSPHDILVVWTTGPDFLRGLLAYEPRPVWE